MSFMTIFIDKGVSDDTRSCIRKAGANDEDGFCVIDDVLSEEFLQELHDESGATHRRTCGTQ